MVVMKLKYILELRENGYKLKTHRLKPKTHEPMG